MQRLTAIRFVRIPISVWILVSVFGAVNAQEISGSGAKKKVVEIKGKNDNGQSMQGRDTIRFTGKSKPRNISVRAGASDYIIVDWVNPSVVELRSADGYLEIKLKIFSNNVIKRENITVWQNRQRISSKMGVGGLFGEQKEFNFTDRIALVEGVNELVVEVSLDSMTRQSEPLIVHRRGGAVSLQPMGVSYSSMDPLSSIYWWTNVDPVALKGTAYTHKDELLPLKFKILTRESIVMEKIRIHHNGNIVKPRANAVLEKDQQGNYSFTDTLTLVESDDLNQVYLEIVAGSYTVTSEKLLVNYSPVRPNLHVLSIGTETNLQYTLKDARDFARLFSRQDGDKGNRLFNKISIDTLFGRKATASEIKGTIEELKIRYYTGSIGSDDVVLAFISSHGFLLDGDFRIQGDDYSPARQRSTSVSFKQDVAGILKDIPCKKILLVDACHSGGARANPADINFAINQLNNVEKGLTVFASSSGEEQSYEDPVWQNGAFTEAILSGLREGKADADRNRIVSLHELYRYVSSEVAAIVKDVKDRPQHPMLVNDELGDVAIYVMDQKNEP